MAEKKRLYTVVDHDKDIKFERSIKDPEEKLYLICISTMEYDMWNLVYGRSNTREYIIDNIEDINFEESFVLVEGVDLTERVSIYAFMKHIERFFPNDPFDIEDYIKGDWSEDEYMKHNDIDPIYSNANSNNLSMEELMSKSLDRISLE